MPELFEIVREDLLKANYNDLHPLVENHLYCLNLLTSLYCTWELRLVGRL
jgi:hypothetical protein